jgi:hypothetical protein
MEFLAFQIFHIYSTSVMMVDGTLGEAASGSCGRSQRSLKEAIY